jgi:hypothetical protein
MFKAKYEDELKEKNNISQQYYSIEKTLEEQI